MKIAVFPGSFDPVTLGHIDVIRRASALFDRVYVCVMANGEKSHGMFTDEERFAMLAASVGEFPNVTAEQWSGLLAEYAAQREARFIVKGVRNATDFDLEYGFAQINKTLNAQLDTVLLCADEPYLHISSTMVREMIRYRCPLEPYMPVGAIEFLKGRN